MIKITCDMTRKAGILLTIIALLSVYGLKAQMINEQTMKFGRTLALVEAFYVDSTDKEKLTEKAIIEILKNLDPHSIYIPKDELEEIN